MLSYVFFETEDAIPIIPDAVIEQSSHVTVYYDISTGNLYRSNGQLFGNSVLTAYLNNDFILELHYVENVNTSTYPQEWDKWYALGNKKVSSTLAFDKDYKHSSIGNVSSSASIASTQLSVKISTLNKSGLSDKGRIFINPYGDTDNKIIVSYSSYTYNEDNNVYTFTISEEDGLPINVSSGTLVRISTPLLFSVDSNTIYEANIPNEYDKGVFYLPVSVKSYRLLNEFDSTGASYISGILEHNIYIKKTKVTGLSVSGYSDALVRNNEYDKYASDDGGETSSFFCYWSNGTVSYYTKGNEIDDGNALYSIDGSVATLETATADPVIDTDTVLFRTLAVPFAVRNILDYNSLYTVPFEETDWSTDYIVSVVKNNIGQISGGTSSYSFNTNEFYVGAVISIKEISQDKISGLLTSLDEKQDVLTSDNAGNGIKIEDGTISVSEEYTSDLIPKYNNLGEINSSYTGGTTIEKNIYYTASSAGYVYVAEASDIKVNINGATLRGACLYPIQVDTVFRVESEDEDAVFARFDGIAVEYSFAPTVTANITERTSGTVTLTATWSSAASQRLYRAEGSAFWSNYTQGLTGIDSNTVYYFKAIDSKGMEVIVSYSITNIVPIAPTVSASTTEVTSNTISLNVSWGSGSSLKQYRIEKANGIVLQNWTSCSDSVSASANAVYKFRAKKDNGEYYSDVTGYTVSNLTAPVINFSGYNNTTPIESTSIIARTRTGATIQWRKGSSGSWNTYVSAVSVTSNGTYNFIATDIAGSQGTYSITFNNITDLTPPVLTLYYDNQTPDISGDILTAETNEPATIYYKKEGDADWTSYDETEPFSLTITKNATYYFKATDTAGNTCETQIVVYENIAGGHVTPSDGDQDPED